LAITTSDLSGSAEWTESPAVAIIFERIMEITSHGKVIPDILLDDLKDRTDRIGDPELLKAAIEEDGYLRLRGLLDREEVLAARRQVFSRLGEVGEIRDDIDVSEGIATGSSRRAETVSDLGEFWKSVSLSPALVKVAREGALKNFFDRFLEAPSRAFDFIWLRTMTVGRASGFHYDHVYMNRGTENLYSVWIPLGDYRMREGTLAVIEGSHRFDDLIESYRGLDVDKDKSRSGTISTDPVEICRQRNVRLLSADFEAGDLMVLPMFSLHGALDNNSPEGRIRLSCDVRYQRADEPFDPRWMGDQPEAHGGSYGAMSAARPMTADPIFR
jgi:hypothetical protein